MRVELGVGNYIVWGMYYWKVKVEALYSWPGMCCFVGFAKKNIDKAMTLMCLRVSEKLA